MLQEKEIASGGGAPRMLSIDDYFMVEVEKKETDPDTGKKVTKKVIHVDFFLRQRT
jgi:YLP motif-containing protein 1